MSELDSAGPELAALAAIAERGECIERGLLTPQLRAACERALTAWQAFQETHDGLRSRALDASRTIATTGLDHAGYRAAVRAFRSARVELARLRPHRRRSRDSAHKARSQLEHDRRQRRERGSEIQRAREARAELTDLLGSRLAKALDGRSLPGWFTEVLGETPCAAEPGRWWATAVSLLAYRITYRIADPGEALGARPGPSACPRQRQWFSELDRDLFARPLPR